MKIKVCYNWIGPKGPLANNEVPTVLSLAHVSDAKVDSKYVIAEGLWDSLFKNDSDFTAAPVFNLSDEDIFIYPMSLHCRINVSIYMTNNEGLLEFAHVSPHVIHHVRCSNGYFLIELAAEVFVDDHYLNSIHAYFASLDIPMYKVIYLTGCSNVDEIYEDYCTRHQIPDDTHRRLKIVYLPLSYLHIASMFKYYPSTKKYDDTIKKFAVPHKLFLSWNRRYKYHRTALAISLFKSGILHRSFYSMQRASDETSQKFEDSFPHTSLEPFGITSEDIKEFTETLPLIVDGAKSGYDFCENFSGKTDSFYENSLISIVTETTFNERTIALTEKIFKVMQKNHPFILVGSAGSIKALHTMGFQTFSEFWSEEYDNIKDSNARLCEIIRLCGEIAQWDPEKILDFKKKVKPIIDHNNQVVRTRPNCFDIIKKHIEETHPIRKAKMKKVLVCGAGGFIGSHLVKDLKQQGHHVIGVDLHHPIYESTAADSFHIMDLRDTVAVKSLMTSDIDEVYQLAADMGGAGYVFVGTHDADIMHNSAMINLNVLEAMREKGVKKVFYSSSACIYPQFNQTDPNNPICSEASAYPANPDSDYGWEKLFSERLYAAYSRNFGIEVRIARFHNIFGPKGSWNNGKEKAPAALCRKVAMSTGEVEIWGPGDQTRSFLFIEDCITGIHKMMAGTYDKPLNMGSERKISMNDLVSLIARMASKEVTIKNIPGPIGVMGRNSDNNLIREVLGWSPPESLEHGLQKTYEWIVSQLGTTDR
jgi:GDP-D-mannose 3',5'-epimerase